MNKSKWTQRWIAFEEDFTKDQIDRIFILLRSETFEQSTSKVQYKLIRNALKRPKEKNVLKHLANIDLNNN